MVHTIYYSSVPILTVTLYAYKPIPQDYDYLSLLSIPESLSVPEKKAVFI
jgi:hypothetical protein